MAMWLHASNCKASPLAIWDPTLTSSDSSDPNASTPTVPPMTAMPTPAAPLAGQFDRRSGTELGRARLGWGERGGLYRDGCKGQ